MLRQVLKRRERKAAVAIKLTEMLSRKLKESEQRAARHSTLLLQYVRHSCRLLGCVKSFELAPRPWMSSTLTFELYARIPSCSESRTTSCGRNALGC